VVSALLLQRQLSRRRYETAFMMLHKLRRAIVNSAREPLKGGIEVDAWVGGPQARLRGSRARLEDAGFMHVPHSQPLRTHLKACEVDCGVVGGSCHW
jgi:hypothetical protein